MKIATYNIQNIFYRHSDLIVQNRKSKLNHWYKEFESLLKKTNSKDSDYARMRELAYLLDLDRSDKKLNNYHNINQVMGVIPILPEAIHHKAKVIFDINPDILLLQEVESRASLLELNSLIYVEKKSNAYKEILHLDGNGQKGIGMGILLKEGYRIKAIKSFSSERDVDGSFLFTNDLQSYKIETPLGQHVYILSVQLVSDSYDYNNESKRNRQAEMVSKVYQNLRSMGNELIIVLGTLNDSNYSKSISPILESDMINVSKLEIFDVELDNGADSIYHRLGAFRKGVNLKQVDYLLAAPYFKDKVMASGLNRKAIWPLTYPKWSTYESMSKEGEAASEHPLIWAEFRVERSFQFYKQSA